MPDVGDDGVNETLPTGCVLVWLPFHGAPK